MSLRTRLILAFAAVVVIPVALLAFGLRGEMNRRLSEEYQRRVDRVVEVIREDLAHESAGIADRLTITERAVEKHIRSIFLKLDLGQDDHDHRRVQAVLRYLRGSAED